MARVVFFLIGLLLSVTAVLKLWMLLTDPFADITAQMPRLLLWVAFIVEGALVVALLSRLDMATKWILVFLVFCAFGCFSLIRLLMGYASCGCTGAISLPPWASLAMNIAVIGLLLGIRPSIVELASRTAGFWVSLKSPENRGRILAIFAACVLLGFFMTPSISARLGTARSITGRIVGLPAKLEAGKSLEVRATLTNRLSHPVTVLGVSKSCTCIADPAGLPRSIQASGQVEFSFRVTPRQLGRFRQRMICYVDVPGQNAVPLDLSSFVSSISKGELP